MPEKESRPRRRKHLLVITFAVAAGIFLLASLLFGFPVALAYLAVLGILWVYLRVLKILI